jgi:hypothetical protein
LILASFGILLADRKVIDATVPVLFGFGFLLFGLLSFSIALFNWPKILVPPAPPRPARRGPRMAPQPLKRHAGSL